MWFVWRFSSRSCFTSMSCSAFSWSFGSLMAFRLSMTCDAAVASFVRGLRSILGMIGVFASVCGVRSAPREVFGPPDDLAFRGSEPVGWSAPAGSGPPDDLSGPPDDRLFRGPEPVGWLPLAGWPDPADLRPPAAVITGSCPASFSPVRCIQLLTFVASANAPQRTFSTPRATPWRAFSTGSRSICSPPWLFMLVPGFSVVRSAVR